MNPFSIIDVLIVCVMLLTINATHYDQSSEITSDTTKSFSLQIADVSSLQRLLKVFRRYRSIFPHIRSDYIKRRLQDSEVVHADGVWILFQRYKKRQHFGNVLIPSKSYMIHQIVNEEPGNGKASDVLRQFFFYCGDESIYLTVRSDNLRARRFYEKNGMVKIGHLAWKNGTVPGAVYKWNLHEFVSRNQ